MQAGLQEIVDNSANTVFFGGAGVSTESGIPDFRSESGSFQALRRYGKPPEVLLSHSYFCSNPEVVFAYFRENLIHPEARPNGAHLALARWEREGRLRAVVTQNIDGLHQMAGSGRVYELHGSMHRNYCMDCGARYTSAQVLDPAMCDGPVPRCTSCGGVVRPDIVMYEETLPEDVVSGAIAAIAAADTLIVAGTSLAVYPAAGLLRYFRGKHLVLINLTPTPADAGADLVIHAPVGEVLSALE